MLWPNSGTSMTAPAAPLPTALAYLQLHVPSLRYTFAVFGRIAVYNPDVLGLLWS